MRLRFEAKLLLGLSMLICLRDYLRLEIGIRFAIRTVRPAACPGGRNCDRGSNRSATYPDTVIDIIGQSGVGFRAIGRVRVLHRNGSSSFLHVHSHMLSTCG